MKRKSTAATDVMRRANSPTFSLLVLAGFLALAQHAWRTHPPVHEPTSNERIGALLDAYEREARPVRLHRVERPHAFRFSEDEPDDVYGALFEACEANPKCYQPKKRKRK